MSEKTAKEEYKEAWGNLRHDVQMPAEHQDWDGFWHYHDSEIASAAWDTYYAKTGLFTGWSKFWKRERFIGLLAAYNHRKSEDEAYYAQLEPPTDRQVSDAVNARNYPGYAWPAGDDESEAGHEQD